MGGAHLDAPPDATDAQAGGAAPKGMQPLSSGERPFTGGAKRRPLNLSDHQWGPDRYKTMTLPVAEFIRRFLMHVLPGRFHRIRHYGLLANGNRAAYVARARELLGVEAATEDPDDEIHAETNEPSVLAHPCPGCGGRMIVIEVFEAGCKPRHRPTPEGIDSS